MQQSKKQDLKVRFPENLQSGVYANNTVVSHNREEFILDFMMVAPPGGSVVSRVVVSPGHLKRILAAIQDNLKRYESTYGSLPAVEMAPVKFND